ncbi:AraC family transcriptional regulator [Paenibacillus sp. 1P07SE]|uniref:helix-turn-helix transcriptional regulator n=1 Tax=Paenibacillus sp. 1P07SE TaxID=3132209 RepID=UPI0039A67BE6
MLLEIDTEGHDIYLYEKKHSQKYEFADHYHNIHQIVYALEGTGTVAFEGRQHTISPGKAAIITPGTVHSIRSDSRLTLLVVALSDQTFLQGELASRVLRHARVISLSAHLDNEIRRLLRTMLFEQARRSDFYTIALSCHLTEICLIFHRTLQTEDQGVDLNYVRAESIRDYIDMYFYDISNLTSDIGSKLNISSRHADNIFKEYYHVTPRKYLTEVRIEHSRKQLAETDKDIVTICFEAGYENLSTFYRTFKNATGLSPNKYRQTYNEQFHAEQHMAPADEADELM